MPPESFRRPKLTLQYWYRQEQAKNFRKVYYNELPQQPKNCLNLGKNPAYQYQEPTFEKTIFTWKPDAKVYLGKLGNIQHIVIV